MKRRTSFVDYTLLFFLEYDSFLGMDPRNLLFYLSDGLVRDIYRITLKFPYPFQSSVGDQLRRASLSVVLNIVEGGARKSIKEKRQFRNIAFSSLKETKYLLYFSLELELINQLFYEDKMKRVNKLAAILYGLLYKK